MQPLSSLREVVARLSAAERALVVLFGAWVAAYAAASALGLDLESRRARMIVSIAFWCVPFAFLPLSFRVRRLRVRVPVAGLAVLLALFALLPISCAYVDFDSILVDGRETLHVIPLSASHNATLYRTNCGAPCSFGLLLIEERRVVPGVKQVRRLGDWYPADSATITPLGDRRYRVVVEPYRGHHPPDPGRVDTVRLAW